MRIELSAFKQFFFCWMIDFFASYVTTKNIAFERDHFWVLQVTDWCLFFIDSPEKIFLSPFKFIQTRLEMGYSWSIVLKTQIRPTNTNLAVINTFWNVVGQSNLKKGKKLQTHLHLCVYGRKTLKNHTIG